MFQSFKFIENDTTSMQKSEETIISVPASWRQLQAWFLYCILESHRSSLWAPVLWRSLMSPHLLQPWSATYWWHVGTAGKSFGSRGSSYKVPFQDIRYKNIRTFLLVLVCSFPFCSLHFFVMLIMFTGSPYFAVENFPFKCCFLTK